MHGFMDSFMDSVCDSWTVFDDDKNRLVQLAHLAKQVCFSYVLAGFHYYPPALIALLGKSVGVDCLFERSARGTAQSMKKIIELGADEERNFSV
ncbi:unnamed protein product [Toxocara canis]|uniref:Rab-GAP TBC domain-containing protein n=1 Tax=Toxocara canis TaxID=6265 RepID=A0A183V3Z3_TOXCA|nr:unnamed protein product [Toxocara canis]